MSFHGVHLQNLCKSNIVKKSGITKRPKKKFQIQPEHIILCGLELNCLSSCLFFRFAAMFYSTRGGSNIKMKLIEAISDQLCEIYVMLMLNRYVYVYVYAVYSHMPSLSIEHSDISTYAHAHAHILVREFYFITWTSIILLMNWIREKWL